MKRYEFSQEAKAGVYQVIRERRDIRAQFLDTPIEDDVLERLLTAAHQAPSVGFMQPWNFILVRDQGVKVKVHQGFKQATEEAANMFAGERREQYKTFKLEGILESPLNICITCDRTRSGKVVIGRTANPSMDLYSVVCAVQNLWLAARAEGIGVGWVSIIHDDDIRSALNIPEHIIPIAYLCVGYVSHFPERPELETAGWLPRRKLEELIFFDQWGRKD